MLFEVYRAFTFSQSHRWRGVVKVRSLGWMGSVRRLWTFGAGSVSYPFALLTDGSVGGMPGGGGKPPCRALPHPQMSRLRGLKTTPMASSASSSQAGQREAFAQSRFFFQSLVSMWPGNTMLSYVFPLLSAKCRLVELLFPVAFIIGFHSPWFTFLNCSLFFEISQ